MIKVTDLEYYIFIAFTLTFYVKSLLSEGGGISQGDENLLQSTVRSTVPPLLTYSSLSFFGLLLAGCECH